MKCAALVLIVGLTWFVFLQVGVLATQPAYRVHCYGAELEHVRAAWQPRVAALALARAVRAYRNVPAWIAAWFALSCLAWFVARGAGAIAPCALLGVAALAIYHPSVGVGTMSSEGPVMFWFTLAAITRKKAATWWPLIGLAAIPFKQTGMALVLVAAWLSFADGERIRAYWVAGAGCAVLWLCSCLGGGALAGPLELQTVNGVVRLTRNLRLLFVERPSIWLAAGGTVLAGLVAKRDRVLVVMLLIAGVVAVVGNVWEPRIWIELSALSAGVLGDRRTV